MTALRDYPRPFLNGRHTLGHFDGSFSIYLLDRTDVRRMQEQFPSLIVAVQNVY